VNDIYNAGDHTETGGHQPGGGVGIGGHQSGGGGYLTGGGIDGFPNGDGGGYDGYSRGTKMYSNKPSTETNLAMLGGTIYKAKPIATANLLMMILARSHPDTPGLALPLALLTLDMELSITISIVVAQDIKHSINAICVRIKAQHLLILGSNPVAHLGMTVPTLTARGDPQGVIEIDVANVIIPHLAVAGHSRALGGPRILGAHQATTGGMGSLLVELRVDYVLDRRPIELRNSMSLPSDLSLGIILSALDAIISHALRVS
ncbi:hypothetical protein FOZ62_010411, partial [Perkinsus olseni]